MIAALAAALMLSAAQAQTTRPGTEVVNIARVTWQLAGSPGAPLTAEARFTVARPTSTGVLTAWELDKGLTQGPFREIIFARGDYQVNPFLPLPEPLDTSTLTGDPVPVDRSAPLRVFRADRIRLGVPVFFTLADPGLNFDPAVVDTAVVTLTDSVTGDTERLRFYETGPDTGEFSAWINTTTQAAISANGSLATRALSVITAQYNDLTNVRNDLTVAVDVGPIDPFGVVFDSRSGQPLNGISVTIVDAVTGAPAQVFGEDMQAAYPAQILSGSLVTDASGRQYQMAAGAYRFPFVAPGQYRLVIGAVETHAAPSTVADADLQGLPGGPFALVAGSRLEPFTVAPGPPLRIDVPLDPRSLAQITRDASHQEAGLADFIEYTVTVTLADGQPSTVEDRLPTAIRYLDGSLRIDGEPATPRLSADGRSLRYDLPMVPPGRAQVITYGAQIVPPAAKGDQLVSQSLLSGRSLLTLQAAHRLRIRDTLGLDQVAILGQISADGCGAPPVATQPHDLSGIRVLLENGEYALTDRDGRFTFRDIYRRPRVVQMDVTTLPAGARPVLCHASPRSAGSAISQFVELRPGLMGRVEFYLVFDAPPAGLPSAAPAEAGTAAAAASPLDSFDQAWLDGRGGSARFGLVAPADGHLPRSDAIDVVVLRPAGAELALAVNGVAVPAIRSEPTLRSADGRRELVRFRAVRIGEGRNVLTAAITAADGTPLVTDAAAVLYGLRPRNLSLIRSASTLTSDGRTAPQVVLRLTDGDGIPIRPGTQVTATVAAPFGFAPDGPVRRSGPATSRTAQTRVTATVGDDGMITLAMAPTLEGGTAQIGIPLAGRSLQAMVPIAVPNRPWVLVGLAEGTVAEQHIRRHMRREGEIGNALAGRVSLFAEGVIRGSWLLTLRYDTAQDTENFYGIDPDADYIVYGDASVQDNAAQGRFPLYLRLRREGAEFLVGDFTTDLNAGGLAITQKVTGLRALFENDAWRVMAFAAETSQQMVEDRIALNGTIGPYQLSQPDIVPNSVTVRLVTVARFDPALELASVTLQAGRDYVVSNATGRLYLRQPFAALTATLDRQVLIVDYEADRDLRDTMLAGIRVERQITERLRLGAAMVQSSRVEGRDVAVTMTGLDLAFAVNDALSLHAETLFTRRRMGAATDTGLRSEVRAEYERDATTVAAYLRRQDGQVGLTAAQAPIDTVVAGLSLRHQLWADPDDAARTLAIEATALTETNRATARDSSDSEILLTRSTADGSQSLGLRSLTQDSAQDLRVVHRGTSVSADGRFSQTLSLEGSINGDATAATDQAALVVDYALTQQLGLFGMAEIARDRSRGDSAQRLTFGVALTPREGRSYRTGLSWAGAENPVRDRLDHGGHALFAGGDHGYDLGDGLTASLGADLQWNRGAADLTFGPSARPAFGTSAENPYIAESFAALRLGMRKDSDHWGAGWDAEARVTDIEETQNLRLQIDGLIGDHWSAGGEAFLGRSRQSGKAAQTDRQIRVSAAHRAGPRDPITLVQTDLRQSETGGVASATAVASVYRAQYLSLQDFLNLRYGIKRSAAALRSGQVADVLQLAGVEYRRDLTESFDLGVHAALLHASQSGRLQGSAGLSLGVTPFDNGWLSIGYNLTGFRDADFSELGQTDQGFFVQFRLKFDAETVRGLFR